MDERLPSRWHPCLVLCSLLFLLAACGSAYRRLPPERDVPEFRQRLELADKSPAKLGALTVQPPGCPQVCIATRESGTPNGRLVVLVHGMFSDSRVWKYVAPDLAADHHVLCLDLPGSGGSTCVSPRECRELYSPMCLARCVLLAMRQRIAAGGVDRITYVGHSYGSFLALRMFSDPGLRAEYADVLSRIDGAVLFSAVDVAIEKDQPMFRQIESLKDWQIGVGNLLGILPQRIATGTAESVVEPERGSREEADRSLEIMRDAPRRHAQQAMIGQAIPTRGQHPDWEAIERITSHYREIAQPCLIVWGARDELFPASMGYRVAMEIPDARLRIIARSMHCLPAERPALCAGLVRQYIHDRASLAERIATVTP